MTVFLNHLGIVCALGDNPDEICEGMYAGLSPLNTKHGYENLAGIYLGDVKTVLPAIAEVAGVHDTRCNQLLLAALSQLAPALEDALRVTPPDRVGVVLGTSTSGIREAETAVREYVQSGNIPQAYDYRRQTIGNCARFLAMRLGCTGPALTVSTACSSSGNAMITAARLLETDTCDVVVAGGVDSLCGMTVLGFSSLEAVSKGISNPFSETRDGINLGEGAALFLMSRQVKGVALSGYGASSDAHHISAPHPRGEGARRAIFESLRMAGMRPDQADYVNLHGTGTLLNDAVEAHVVNDVFGCDTPCSSSKTLTGHTLAAAAAIEAGLCWLVIEREMEAIPHHWLGPYDPELPPINLVERHAPVPRVCVSNSFAFGGSNVSLVLGSPA